MSNAALTWVWEHAPVDLPTGQMLLLVAVADQADDDGVCWPSLDYLSRKTRCHPDTTRINMKGLIDKALVIRVERAGKSNLFGIPVHEGVHPQVFTTKNDRNEAAQAVRRRLAQQQAEEAAAQPDPPVKHPPVNHPGVNHRGVNHPGVDSGGDPPVDHPGGEGCFTPPNPHNPQDPSEELLPSADAAGEGVLDDAGTPALPGLAAPTFDDFWQAWPKTRRVEKPKAREAWAKAVKRADPAAIVAAAAAYAASPNLPEPRFIPYPARWLAADRWTDAPPPPRGDAGGIAARNTYDPDAGYDMPA